MEKCYKILSISPGVHHRRPAGRPRYSASRIVLLRTDITLGRTHVVAMNVSVRLNLTSDSRK